MNKALSRCALNKTSSFNVLSVNSWRNELIFLRLKWLIFLREIFDCIGILKFTSLFWTKSSEKILYDASSFKNILSPDIFAVFDVAEKMIWLSLVWISLAL